MCQDRKKLNDVFDDWLTGGGIFSVLQEYPSIPWGEEDIASELDVIYHGSRSGDKYVSPLVNKIMDGDTLTDTEKNLIATSILAVYGVSWGKEYATRSFEYNPIENYSMTETMTDDETVIEYGHVNTREIDTDHTKSGTETITPDLATDNAVYGFNSAAAVPSGNATQTGTNETAYDTTDADDGSITDTESGSDTHTRNYEMTRAGNIGVTTSQQMIQSERELWIWNFFDDVVFPDIDKILTLKIY